MADFQQRDNSGALFKNDKGDNQSRPDYRGKCVVNGAEMEISAWLKKSRDGRAYMSLSFSEPRDRNGQNSAPSRSSNERAPIPARAEKQFDEPF